MERRGGGEGLLFLLSPSFLQSEIKDGRHVYDIWGTRKNKKDHLEFESIITQSLTRWQVCFENKNKIKTPAVSHARLFILDGTAFASILGSFGNDNGDGNKNVKKAVGLISKTTTMHVQHTFLFIFCRHRTTTTWNSLKRRFIIMEEVKTTKRTSLSLSKLGFVSPGIQENSSTLEISSKSE